jgi:ATP-binding protein involved in chromosome partitioning
MPTPQDILERLKAVNYPGFTRSIVSFGFVKDIEVGGAGVRVTLCPTTQNAQTLEQIRRDVDGALREMGIENPEILFEEPARASLGALRPKPRIGDIRWIVAVASGKGGVGKSTVAANLAVALQQRGRRVGLMDADVYGPSIPVLLGLQERPRADEQKRIYPIERYGLNVISMGLFVEEAKPVLWRGPMITKLLVEFLRNVLWGELDYLVIDLPPGTGDAQLTICQQVPLSGGLIVTTPQQVALLDVQRGITMFRDVNVPVLGVVENMSSYVCRKCGHRADLFGTGGGEAMARRFGVPFLGAIPLAREIRETGDQGTPIVVADPHHPQSQAFLRIAERVEQEIQRAATATSPRGLVLQ